MEILDPTQACFLVDEDILDFTLDGEPEDEFEPKPISKGGSASSSSLESSHQTTPFFHETESGPFPEFVEEELEWLSNKDAFPAVETCFGILSDNPELLSHQSPVSVLENSSSSSNNSNSNNNSNNSGNGGSVASCCGSLKVPTNYPVKARSKRRRRRRRSGFGDLPTQQWLAQVNVKNKQEPSFSLPPLSAITNTGASSMGRRCLHCLADKTPQWRAGPMGPKTLCNACGVRYKSGRLLPEYRPASSPTFSSTLHSNSHRKVVEMRRQKMVTGIGGGANEVCGYRVE